MAQKSEFTVANTYPYNRSSPVRWIFSHIFRYKFLFIVTISLYMTAWFSNTYSRILIGQAAGEIITPTSSDGLLKIGLGVLFILILDSLSALIGSLSVQTIAQRLERDSREELYISLLGKSQTFHDRQRVGDIMARATDDMYQMNGMINPGILFICETIMGLAVPMLWIATIRVQLLLVPIIFVLVYIVTVRSVWPLAP